MSRIVLISCSSKKRKYPCEAEKLYMGIYFTKTLKYAKLLNPDKIYILSAKYHLVDCKTIIEPYNLALKKFKKEDLLKWEKETLIALRKETSLENDEFIILASHIYISNLLKYIKNYTFPIPTNLTIGKKMYLMDKVINNQGLLFSPIINDEKEIIKE